MSIDFKKFRPEFKRILNYLGIDTSGNLVRCIDPAHRDQKPSMSLNDETFKCFSCGVNGDVYDAVGLITGITDPAERYREVERILGVAPAYTPRSQKKNFTPNRKAEEKLKTYLEKKTAESRHEIEEYLKKRKCPAAMIEATVKYFDYWPGYQVAASEFGYDDLKAAGIPGKNPTTNNYSWGPPGVVLKLGRGFKLFYYDGMESKKLGSFRCGTFPTPGSYPDNTEIILVEGEADGVSMLYAGFSNARAIGGVTGVTSDDIESLLRYDVIIILLDGDQAGRTAREILKKKLIAADYTGDILIARLPDGADPDNLIKSGKADIIKKAIENARSKPSAPAAKREAPAEKIKPPFIFVGWTEKNYYIIPKNQSIPISIGRADGLIKNMLCDIAPRRWWLDHFSHKNEIDFPSALEWFRCNAQKKGLYDPGSILGAGAHEENGKIVINTGKNLFIDGKEISYPEYEGELLFSRSRIFFDVSGDPWNERQGWDFFRELCNYGFSNPIDWIILAGWIALAPFSSLLHRRPHLGIMGPKGCGKTTLLDNIIRPAIGSMGVYGNKGQTEAGIRQTIGTNCMTVILDEFEAHNKADEEKNKKILDLARSAYGGDGVVIKGTTSGTPLLFQTQAMFLFLAINIWFDNDADRTRIPRISMKLSKNQIGKTFDFSGLRKRILNNFFQVKNNITDCKKYIADNIGGDARLGDTYGPLIAGCWSVISDSPFLKDTEDRNTEFMSAMLNIGESSEELDEEKLLETILSHVVDVGVGDKQTVAEMIESSKLVSGKPTEDARLKQMGIRRDRYLKISGTAFNVIAIAAKNKYIKEMLKDSAFQGDYKNILSRHPAVMEEKTRVISMGGELKTRCIILDWKKVEKIHFNAEPNLF